MIECYKIYSPCYHISILNELKWYNENLGLLMIKTVRIVQRAFKTDESPKYEKD